jgi:hypothetical protein
VRILACGMLCAQASVHAQEIAAVSVPFVGCKSYGQVGPTEAPKGTSRPVPITAQEAQGLAYYRSAQGPAVLAPQGWYCLGISGSSGEGLNVSAQPIDGSALEGPAIEIFHSLGETLGRFEVAQLIARVFPDYKDFVSRTIKLFDFPAGRFTFGPYPNDVLTYKSNTIVEYNTPAQTEGLGTHSLLSKNANPIEGVAMLIGQVPETPDLLLLSVRLPPELTGLTAAIVDEIERDAR